MGFTGGAGSRSSNRTATFRPQKLPIDNSVLALNPDPCHCVADAELDNRYNLLRAEEHARKEGKCGPEWSTEIGERPENSSRNRYPTVIPWDHSRVMLPVEDGNNDYINASWVQMGSHTYIATQGPLPATVHDFWQMVYAYGGDPAVIIMLTPLHEHAVEKCALYWPDSKSHPIVLPKERGFKFGLTISLKAYHKHDHYHYSTFSITPSDPNMPERTVHHVYYHSWLDYSKPNADADLRSLVHLVNNKLKNRACPLFVHCSAGIGRTGTFIALDSLLSRIDSDILPAVIPKVSPIWKVNQEALQFRKSLFTGAEDMHVESESNNPLLSKFDVAHASAVPSIMTQSQTTASPARDADSSAATLGTFKRTTPEEQPESRQSLLSAAIANSKNTDTTSATHLSDFTTPQTQCECAEEEDEKVAVINGDAENNSSPPRKSSALSGPAIRKVTANITSVAPEVFSETPATVDVMDWYDPQDPVMNAIRTMRKQRPKMVQGKQQLGYIYDQFEVGQQLARVTHHANQPLRRKSTISSLASTPESSAGSPSPSSHHHLPSKPLRVLSLVGLRRSSTDSTKSDADSPSSVASSLSTRRRGFFSGSVLR